MEYCGLHNVLLRPARPGRCLIALWAITGFRKRSHYVKAPTGARPQATACILKDRSGVQVRQRAGMQCRRAGKNRGHELREGL
jgi:hypothetical protein